MRPRIGVTCAFGYTEERCFLRQAYIRSVLAAGGLPVLLPNVSEEALATAYLDLVDGLLLSGGGPGVFWRIALSSPGRDKS